MWHDYVIEGIFYTTIGVLVAGAAAVSDKMLSIADAGDLLFPDPQSIIQTVASFF